MSMRASSSRLSRLVKDITNALLQIPARVENCNGMIDQRPIASEFSDHHALVLAAMEQVVPDVPNHPEEISSIGLASTARIWMPSILEHEPPRWVVKQVISASNELFRRQALQLVREPVRERVPVRFGLTVAPRAGKFAPLQSALPSRERGEKPEDPSLILWGK